MKQTRQRFVNVLAVTALVAGAVFSATGAQGADHLDAPGVERDGRTDINDLYAFQSPNNPDNTVLIMTVNPLAGDRSGTSFHPNAEYTFNIDRDGDAVANRSITVDFSKVNQNGQRFRVKLGNRTVAHGDVGGQTDIRRVDGLAAAGTFDDPFFFDLVGFRDGFNFTGDDFFAGANVTAIVVEVPSSWIGGNVGIWATTSVRGQQIDRMGRPAINTVLIPADRKDEFNAASPANDFATFGADVNATIASLSSQANADALTAILLPDVLTFDTSDPGGFLNGRQLADDVIDAELGLLSAGAVTTDMVGANDVPFRGQFPYLASANG